ncbi:acyl-CoA dehydrogenase family protein [Candidimonas nitroreducens]|uniref:Medium-chain specific acyl-CoA dehydrogenase, mitochondrial n=1 Tax=Candidimonas nitroreducens TaxID=683354 RepID=A0A225MHR4_9BURK|nr:acyl-CoA dehydrogenase [Candidimonas nitroreducens]OWT59051.1 acyl-CoA dehydrogenase [Candidimonas nitroreducens]
MDFEIDSDTVLFADGLLRFIDQEVVPLEQANRALFENERNLYQEDGRFVPEVRELRRKVRMRSAELGFYGAFAAEELGGLGLGVLANVHVQEQLNHRYGPARKLIQTVVLPSPFTNGLSPVLRHLDPEVFAHYQEGIASGEKTLCFCLSEPDAGSDAFAIKTRAERSGDGWVISGTKQWITNAPYADYAMVFAVTDPELAQQRKGGITGFFVDTSDPGFTVSSVIPTMGHLGAEIGVVVLDQVRVADDHRLGPVGEGLSKALSGVHAGRLSMAASCVGMARWALDLAVDYAKVRRTFGKPIGEHQAVQQLLADSAIDIYAAKNMVQNCAWRIAQGERAIAETSMVKAFATEMLNRVMDRSIQVHGAVGLSNALRLEEGYRLARQMRIPDGTGEIQRRMVARALLRGNCNL